MFGKPVRREELTQNLTNLGVPKGGLLLVHSSLRSIGYVDGGVQTVVGALLDALGPQGTLMVPTFIYPILRSPDFVFDPHETPSCMGAISEAARRHPEAHRSIKLDHSYAALGPLAETIIDKAHSSWGDDSPLVQLIRRGGMVLLLGVPYTRMTLAHQCEVLLSVPYRKTTTITGRLRRSDGAVVSFSNMVTPPAPGHPGSDYNRLGQRLEDAGKVKTGLVGNAMARLVYARDVFEIAKALYREDPKGFLKQNNVLTPLRLGISIETSKGVICVSDPSRIYNP
jgi:aminoglycoside 3-N-acetyltransferase